MLTFDKERHEYQISGRVVPSVTQVLAPLEDFEGVPRAALEHARIRGQHVHEAMALLVRDELDWDSLDDELVPYLEGGKRFLDESGAVVIASEKRVHCSRMRVAGTLDLIAQWRDSECVMDFKATAVMPKGVGPQTAAYDRLDSGGKRKRKRFCVLLKPNDYRIFPLTDSSDLTIFQSCLNVWHWKNS